MKDMVLGAAIRATLPLTSTILAAMVITAMEAFTNLGIEVTGATHITVMDITVLPGE